MSTRIVIFAKAPVEGLAKTRLIPLLGRAGAAHLAQEMLEHSCASARLSGLPFELCVTPDANDRAWTEHLPNGVRATDQGDGDLGARMSRAVRRIIDGGEGAILVGTDCPGLQAHHLRAAATSLRRVDAFLHPAVDGGYALFALRRHSPLLFSDIRWSGPDVFSATIDRLRQLGWSSEVGEPLRDVDEPADALEVLAPFDIARLRRAGDR